jgi:hypothetical protein
MTALYDAAEFVMFIGFAVMFACGWRAWLSTRRQR